MTLKIVAKRFGLLPAQDLQERVALLGRRPLVDDGLRLAVALVDGAGPGEDCRRPSGRRAAPLPKCPSSMRKAIAARQLPCVGSALNWHGQPQSQLQVVISGPLMLQSTCAMIALLERLPQLARFPASAEVYPPAAQVGQVPPTVRSARRPTQRAAAAKAITTATFSNWSRPWASEARIARSTISSSTSPTFARSKKFYGEGLRLDVHRLCAGLYRVHRRAADRRADHRWARQARRAAGHPLCRRPRRGAAAGRGRRRQDREARVRLPRRATLPVSRSGRLRARGLVGGIAVVGAADSPLDAGAHSC